MLSQEAEEYSNLINVNLDEKLKPLNETIDQMLTRLEEFESMIAIVQQERCNAIGITGSLTDVVQRKSDLQALGHRIDALENLVAHINNNISNLEDKVDQAEEQFGFKDNATKLKSFFTPLFKKGQEVKETNKNQQELFSTSEYFNADLDNN